MLEAKVTPIRKRQQILSLKALAGAYKVEFVYSVLVCVLKKFYPAILGPSLF